MMKSSEDIIAKINRKDHALRVMLVILALVIVAAQSLVIALVWITNDKLNQTIQQISQEDRQHQSDLGKQLQEIQRQHRDQDTYLTCIAEQLSKSRKITACPAPFNTPVTSSTAPAVSYDTQPTAAISQKPNPVTPSLPTKKPAPGLAKRLQDFINSIIPGAH